MNIANRSLLSSAFVIAIAFTAGCTDQGNEDIAGTITAPLENDAIEKSMVGPARYTAEWARELFPANAAFYVYKDGDLVTGAVIFSGTEQCQFQDIAIVDGRAQIHSTVCSGAIAGATLDVSCKLRAGGDFACTGSLQAPQGDTGTGTMYSDIVYAPDGAYEGPKQPIPGRDEHGNCPGSQSPCGSDSCCAEFERCGDGQCWMPVAEL